MSVMKDGSSYLGEWLAYASLTAGVVLSIHGDMLHLRILCLEDEGQAFVKPVIVPPPSG